MKKLVTLLLIITSSSTLFSQKNAVKLHLESLAFGAVNIAYERNLGPKVTAGINVGLFIPRDIPFYTPARDTAANYIDTKDLENNFSGLMITPELRFYPKGNGKGFYMGGYLKYCNYKIGMSQTSTYQLSDDEYNNLDANADYYANVNHATKEIDVTTNVDYKLGQLGAGLQLGVQWLIADRFVIDWGFIGLGYNAFKATGELTIIDIPVNYSNYASEAESSINKELENFPIGNPKASVVGKNNSLKASVPFGMIGIRSFLSIGMKF